MFEWNVLCQSGQDLSGVGGKLRRVTMEELERHSSEGDVWTAVRGTWWFSFSKVTSNIYVVGEFPFLLMSPLAWLVTVFFQYSSRTEASLCIQ